MFGCQDNYSLTQRECVTVFVISIPHLLYLFIWKNAVLFDACIRYLAFNDAVSCFSFIAGFLKVVQAIAFITDYFEHADNFASFVGHLSSISLNRWVLASLLICAGQTLNLAIYHAIGIDGVYYGFLLGKVSTFY